MDKKQPISVGLYYQKVYVHYKDGTDETIEFDNIKDAFEKYSDISSQIPPQITDQQYNAVVAQNKSLQGELRLYKKIVQLMLLDINNGKILLDYQNQAVKEWK